MDLLLTLIGMSVGAVLTLLGQRLVRFLRPLPSCTWCATASGWPVTGHPTHHCRGYITMVRQRHPSFGGNAWRQTDSR
ncbi:hypothetical protein [Streptomyces sp. NPDC055912]|uniref:hypothetical protein n=1 Tax=Streptomyces sp. NPDC055912 TaxID=3345660 RepID=UPI0035E2A542